MEPTNYMQVDTTTWLVVNSIWAAPDIIPVIEPYFPGYIFVQSNYAGIGWLYDPETGEFTDVRPPVEGEGA